MLSIFAMVFTCVCVFGAFVAFGGSMGVVIHGLMSEMPMILGAAVGAFLLGNNMPVVKGAMKGMGKAFKGPKWKAQDYKDILLLMFGILKLVRTKGMIVLEQHIENPEQSSIFQQYPKIMHDHFAVEFICDTLRMMTMNFDDPHQVEDVMEKQLEKHHHELHQYAHSIQSMADAMPALGIVAAVLGVIKTMGSINKPVEVLGEMIGGALTGTFLGVFLAYGFIGPIASKMGQCYDQEHKFYEIIRAILISHLNGNAPQISAEIGRTNVPTIYQPTFREMEELQSNINFA
ncbi:MAG: flagellar motor stator protein MotA [Azospirillum brasilense]|nr:MAG: flagellar motor stator protein MotA [Azospirillum brasilense]